MPAAPPKSSAAALSVSHCIHFPRLPREDSGKNPDSTREIVEGSKEIGLLCRKPKSCRQQQHQQQHSSREEAVPDVSMPRVSSSLV